MKKRNLKLLAAPIALGLAAGFASAATVVVNDNTPTAGAPTGATSVYNGTNQVTYTVSGVDLTAEGGTASEEIVYTVTVSSTDTGSTFATRGGSGGFAHISTAHANDFISAGATNNLETNFTYTGAISSTTFSGGTGSISLDFTSIFLANFGFNGGTSTTDSADIVSGAGTQAAVDLQNVLGFGAGDTVTLNNYGASAFFGANGYNLQLTINPVPEPSSAALLGLGALGLLARRKRA